MRARFAIVNASSNNLSTAEAMIYGPAHTHNSELAAAISCPDCKRDCPFSKQFGLRVQSCGVFGFCRLKLTTACGGEWYASQIFGLLPCQLLVHLPPGASPKEIPLTLQTMGLCSVQRLTRACTCNLSRLACEGICGKGAAFGVTATSSFSHLAESDSSTCVLPRIKFWQRSRPRPLC